MAAEAEVVEGEEDVGEFFDFFGAVVGVQEIEVDAGGDDRAGGRKILLVAAETGDDGPAFFGVDDDGLAADGVSGGQQDADAVQDLLVAVQEDDFVVVQEIREIAVIHGVGVFEKLVLPFLDIDPGLGAFVIVFAVVVVQVGMDNDVDVFGGQRKSCQGVFKFLNFDAIFRLHFRGHDELLQAGVHQNFLLAALQIKDIDGDPDAFAVAFQIGHDTLVGGIGADYERMDGVFGHKSSSKFRVLSFEFRVIKII